MIERMVMDLPSQEFALIHPINPVTEMMPPEEFIDRDDILRYLEEWFRNIASRRSRSKALISPRRMGKTAVLDRLVNVMFWRDYGVVPFYFKVKREETTLREFTEEYIEAFFQYFMGYILKDPSIVINKYKLKDLAGLDVAIDEGDSYGDGRIRIIDIVREQIEMFLRYKDTRDARLLWEEAITYPERIAVLTGMKVAVIIDEFQDMKSYIYDAEDVNTVVPGRDMPTDLTATYDRMSQSTHAPMLVSGSAVTMIFRTVMGGPLGGRFTVKKLGPLSIADGAELAKTILAGRGIPISDELALYLSELVGGHPYYVYCVANTEGPFETFATRSEIEAAVEWELQNGVIGGFWSTHFMNYENTINDDPDPGIGKRIIYYLLKYQGRTVEEMEIANSLGITPEVVARKLQKLSEADLVERVGPYSYRGLTDKMLARYIYQVYGKYVEDVDRKQVRIPVTEDLSKGRYLELQVENLLYKFHGQKVDGRLFGREGEFVLPVIIQAYDTVVKAESEREYQVDAIAVYRTVAGMSAWVAECKNRTRPMGKQEVEKLEAAAAAIKAEKQLADVILWFVSTGGFTKEAINLIWKRGYLWSGRNEINELIRFFGGKVMVPGPDDE
ncbi:MAG: hypothetical protein HPY71_15825 [Firmicutes bacterium]|nr:hypothetical protein [Bacillota bacterium]